MHAGPPVAEAKSTLSAGRSRTAFEAGDVVDGNEPSVMRHTPVRKAVAPVIFFSAGCTPVQLERLSEAAANIIDFIEFMIGFEWIARWGKVVRRAISGLRLPEQRWLSLPLMGEGSAADWISNTGHVWEGWSRHALFSCPREIKESLLHQVGAEAMKKASRGTSDVHWWSRELFQLVLSSCERSAFWECVPTTLRIIQEGPARNALQTGERHSGSLQRGGVVATPTCAHGHFTSFLVNSFPKLRQVRRVENVLCIQTFGGGRITIGVTVDFLGQVCPVGGGTYLWDDFGEGCETCLGLFILEDFGINTSGISQKERAHEVFVFKRIGLSGDFEKRCLQQDHARHREL